MLKFQLHLVLLLSQHLVGLHQDAHSFSFLHQLIVLRQGLRCDLSKIRVGFKIQVVFLSHICVARLDTGLMYYKENRPIQCPKRDILILAIKNKNCLAKKSKTRYFRGKECQ